MEAFLGASRTSEYSVGLLRANTVAISQLAVNAEYSKAVLRDGVSSFLPMERPFALQPINVTRTVVG